MRASTLLVWFLFTAGATAAVVGLACSSNGSPPQDANGSTSVEPAPGQSSSSSPASEPSSSSASGSGDPGPSSGEPQSKIANEPPDGGVVMNNATPSQDAGASDRLKPIMDVVAVNRDKYRACFDIWGKKNPTAPETKITLSIHLDPAGAVLDTGFKKGATDLEDAAVEKCMVDVTKGLKFPPSPSGKETTYNHPFKFHPHK